MSKLALRGVEKRYGSTVAGSGLDLALNEGEFVSLLGPSGCGKTTTLRMIAGFIDPTAGTIALNGQLVSLPAGRRPAAAAVARRAALESGCQSARRNALRDPPPARRVPHHDGVRHS